MNKQTNYYVYHNTFTAPNAQVEFIGSQPKPDSDVGTNQISQQVIHRQNKVLNDHNDPYFSQQAATNQVLNKQRVENIYQKQVVIVPPSKKS